MHVQPQLMPLAVFLAAQILLTLPTTRLRHTDRASHYVTPLVKSYHARPLAQPRGAI